MLSLVWLHMGTISMLCKFSDPNYEWHNDLATRSNSTGLKKTFKMAQKRNVKPGMATYGYNNMLCKFSKPKLWVAQRFSYPVEFDRPQKDL